MPDQVSGGAAVVDALGAHGVRDVFGIPGTHNLEIYRHLAGSGIRHVVPRHEQGAGYAADGYARASGRPGVLITTSGPGITNAVTALATSYADSVPTLAISPGVPRGMVGRDVGWLHEVKDQQGVLEAVCGRSIRVERADDIPEVVAEVFEGFGTSRPRPVHLEVPVDVLEGSWSRRPVGARATAAPAVASPAATDSLVEAMRGAERPLMVVGGGARGALDAVRAIADLGIPVVTTVNGKGTLDETHAASLGASLRLPAAHEALNAADLLLIVGSELGDSDLWGGLVEPGRAGRTVARRDLDPAQRHKNVSSDLCVVADATATLDGVVSRLRAAGCRPWSSWFDRHRRAIVSQAASDGGRWAAIQRALVGALPADTVVAGDSSQVTYYGTVHHWPFTTANRLLYPTGYATLGYGLPAAIGAKVAQPGRPVVGLVGDGAAMFSIQELVTATEQRMALPLIVVDNGGYAEIREQMIDRDMTPLAVDLLRPDLVAVARAVGARGVRATTADDIAAEALAALGADVPTLIHVRV